MKTKKTKPKSELSKLQETIELKYTPWKEQKRKVEKVLGNMPFELLYGEKDLEAFLKTMQARQDERKAIIRFLKPSTRKEFLFLILSGFDALMWDNMSLLRGKEVREYQSWKRRHNAIDQHFKFKVEFPEYHEVFYGTGKPLPVGRPREYYWDSFTKELYAFFKRHDESNAIKIMSDIFSAFYNVNKSFDAIQKTILRKLPSN